MNKYFKIRDMLILEIKGSWILNTTLKSKESKLYNIINKPIPSDKIPMNNSEKMTCLFPPPPQFLLLLTSSQGSWHFQFHLSWFVTLISQPI